MTESEAIKILQRDLQIQLENKALPDGIEAIHIAIQALEKQEKIKEIIANANQWSKEDIVVKAQAFCDIEKILRSDEDKKG